MRWPKVFGYTLLALVALAAAYVAYGLWAWRDVPVAELERRYGDDSVQVANVDGVKIRYRLHGNPADGRPVVALVHSHFFDMGMWDAWVEQLSPRVNVLRYDLSGHGLTGPDPSGVYTTARDVELLAGLLDRLEIARVTVAGSSTGGTIAYQLAASHPQLVDTLVFMNSGGIRTKRTSGGRKLPEWGDLFLRLLPPAALHAFVEWMAADKAAVTEDLKTRFVDMWRREGNRKAEIGRLRQYQFSDPDQVLGAITAPTLVMWGQDNPQVPAAMAQTFGDKLTRAARVEVKVYPGAGHLLQIERPAETAADALAFMQGAGNGETP